MILLHNFIISTYAGNYLIFNSQILRTTALYVVLLHTGMVYTHALLYSWGECKLWYSSTQIWYSFCITCEYSQVLFQSLINFCVLFVRCFCSVTNLICEWRNMTTMLILSESDNQTRRAKMMGFLQWNCGAYYGKPKGSTKILVPLCSHLSSLLP